MKILIADDEKYVRLELYALLEELIPSAEIIEAENGTSLKEILEKNEFHLAFIDIKMPGASGLDVLEELHENHRNTQFIILSGYSDFEYARKAIQIGVKDYMLKPVTKEDLATVIKKNLSSLHVLHEEETTENKLIHDAEKLIYKRYKEQIGVAQIAEELNVSPNYLSSQFKKYKDRTLTSFITDLRLKTGAEMLKLPGANVKSIAENLGYQSSRHFARLFREKYQCSPSEFMKNN